MTSRRLGPLLAAACFLTSAPRSVQACGARGGAPATAFPGLGATEVSPQSSIFVTFPWAVSNVLALEANGQPVPLPLGQPLGSGLDGSWLRLPGPLLPSTSYRVLLDQNNSGPKLLTQFTTAASYDKAPGIPAKVTGLRLWRVHYPDRIAASDCVHAEYEGYIDLVYEPGSLPGTPPDEVINVLSLSPKGGGAQQTYVFSGSKRRHLNQVESYLGNELVDVPPGGFPSPVFAEWKPELAPDREYCATLTLHGRNDLAALPAASQTVCAPVMNLVWATTYPDGGGPPDATPSADPPATAPDGGAGKIAPPRPSDASADASAPMTAPDASGPDAAATTGSSSCSMGRGRPPAGIGLLLLGLLAARTRRRR
jgi:MYXO-CTERM domain-containing protein